MPLLEVIKVVIAAVASVVFFMFSGLILAGSAVALTVTAPIFIIFSPILIPATLTTVFLTTGFTAGGTLGATALALIMRLIKLRTTPPGGSWGGVSWSWWHGPIPDWLGGTPYPPAAGGDTPTDGAKPAGGTKPESKDT